MDPETNSLRLLSIFLSSYITEDKFDEEIKRTEELPLLQLLLKMKSHLIQMQRHSLTSYPLDGLLGQFVKKNDEVATIIDLALQIQQDTSQYFLLLNYVHYNLLRTESGCLIPYLKLLNLVLSHSVHERERSILLSFLDSQNFDCVINSLLNADDRTATNYLIVHILPKYLALNTNCTNKTRDFVWKQAVDSQNLDILCTVPNFFLNSTSLSLNVYWKSLQKCLDSTNTILQKQALFLLKESIYLVQKFQLDLDIVSGSATAWANLFMLYEIAREKQLHLVEPAFALLPTINQLHPSWLISIYKILLNHPHNAVCAFAIVHLLHSDWFAAIDVFEQVVACLLPATNKTDFTTNQKIWESFQKFARGVGNFKLEIVIAQSARIRWIPSICYMFYCTMLFGLSISPPPLLVDKVISNINNVPHRTIRTKCFDVVKNSIVPCNLNFEDFVYLNCLLGHDYIILADLNNYVCNIENILTLWQSDHVDLRSVPVLVKVIKTLGGEYLQNLLSLFKLGKLNPNVADHLCRVNCLTEHEIAAYLQTRVPNIKEGDRVIIVPSLQLDALNQVINLSTNILLNDTSNNSQIEFAFEIAHRWVDKGGKVDLLSDVLEKWQGKICKFPFSAGVCCNFVQLYSRGQLAISADRLLETIALFEQMMETQNSAVVPAIFSYLGPLVDSCEIIDQLDPFLEFCLKKWKDLRGSELFKTATCNFVESLLINGAILRGNVHALKKSSSMLWSLLELANTCEDIAYSVSVNLHKLSKMSPTVCMYFIPLAVELLLFGEMLQKDHRAEYAVCQLIFSEKRENNPHHQRIMVRGLAAKCVQHLLKSEQHKKNADTITALLLNKYLKHFSKRYFSDSQIHLTKLRILQGLLLVHDHTVDQKQPLIDTLLNSLSNESHQVSVKFFIIWLLIRLLSTNENCIQIITSVMEKTCKVHASTIIAFIPILYHVALLRNQEAFFSELFKIMLPWTMGAHFNLRLYAQIGVIKLYQLIKSRGFHALCDQYKHILSCVSEVLDKTERKVDVIDEFIFDKFDPYIDYNLEMIYYGIPHITHVTCDEYENMIHIFNCTSRYTVQDLNHWRPSQPKLVKDLRPDVGTNIIQKKMTPQEGTKSPGELIVVASLIDKIPNLGGLSRTCEVFGVKQLTVSSLSVVKNSEFQNLSMSSENWVNIVEVKSEQLQQFLLSMKESGYTIVGAEQTLDSIKLNDFRFPIKCVLLLGNEKEGIPPNLLSFVDQCVEIPQLGVVRSLNVHVAAATFIWEYTKTYIKL
uniref:tRNA (guanosine(18)-2'-O)-methyltransferase TARBP1 n=1 Tax=Photinus pyralis TaxID=7054 RepID=A0A1Y1MDV7_PHOPY